MKYYHHPVLGYHAGSPIGGSESTEITQEEFLASLEPTAEDFISIQQAKLSAIREHRRAIEAGGVEYEGILYDSDPAARAKYVELAKIFDLQPGMTIAGWKASDDASGYGVYVTMTEELLGTLFLLGAQLDAQAFAWEQAKQLEVANAVLAEDLSALQAIVTSS